MTRTISDLAGFIDGLEARNQESIRRKIAPQMEEVKTRTRIMLMQLERKGGEAIGIKEATQAILGDLSDGGVSAVKRIVRAAEGLSDVLERQGEVVAAASEIRKEVKAIALAIVDAAEKSKDQEITEAARRIGLAFKSCVEMHAEHQGVSE